MEILSTLVVGGVVCIPSDSDRINDIPGAIKRMGVTWTLLTVRAWPFISIALACSVALVQNAYVKLACSFSGRP